MGVSPPNMSCQHLLMLHSGPAPPSLCELRRDTVGAVAPARSNPTADSLSCVVLNLLKNEAGDSPASSVSTETARGPRSASSGLRVRIRLPCKTQNPQKRVCVLHEPADGFEPPTYCLQNSCSTTELCRREIYFIAFFYLYFFFRFA